MFKLIQYYIANPGSGARKQFERMLMFCAVLFYGIGYFVAPRLGVSAACFTLGVLFLSRIYIDTKSKTTRGRFGRLYTDIQFPGGREVNSLCYGFAVIALLVTSVLIVTDNVPDKFRFHDRVYLQDKLNFQSDHQQASYYMRDLSGVRGKLLNDALDQMTFENRNELFIASAIEYPTELTLEWITANTQQPDCVIATLDTGVELSFTVTDVNSTSAVSYFTNIPTENRIPIESTVESVRICIGLMESEEYTVPTFTPADGG